MLSVIVPVYNCENSIEHCIASIIRQSFYDLEVVVVDDGSTDNTLNECLKLQKIDQRIKVVTGDNIGAIGARKKGFLLSKGNLVTFVDADDWIECDMYSNLMSVYEKTKADIITSGFVKDDGSYIDSFSEGYYDRESINNSIVHIMMYDEKRQLPGITQSLCNKIFNRDLVEKIFLETVDTYIADDAKVVYLAILDANGIAVTHGCWYHYVNNSKSKTHKYNLQLFEGIQLFKVFLENEFEKHGVLYIMRPQLEAYVRNLLRVAIRNTYDIEMERARFFFPFHLIPANSKLVIHGAGDVGRSYWHFVKDGEYANVVAWVDNDKMVRMNSPFYSIQEPSVVKEIEFDFILIAVFDEKIANLIMSGYEDMGIDSNRLIWAVPKYRI